MSYPEIYAVLRGRKRIRQVLIAFVDDAPAPCTPSPVHWTSQDGLWAAVVPKGAQRAVADWLDTVHRVTPLAFVVPIPHEVNLDKLAWLLGCFVRSVPQSTEPWSAAWHDAARRSLDHIRLRERVGVVAKLVEDGVLPGKNLDELATQEGSLAALCSSSLTALRQGHFAVALQMYDRLIGHDVELSVYTNALYAVQHDNSGLGLQPERVRQYVSWALPHGPANPPIFHNAACALIELGDEDGCVAALQSCIEHGSPDLLAQVINEALFTAVHHRPELTKLFSTLPTALRTNDSPSQTTATGALDPESAKRLIGFTTALSGGDVTFTQTAQALTQSPPTTFEEVGFYLSGDELPQENAFRAIVTVLRDADMLMGAEDKMCMEVFSQWAEHIELPKALTTLFALWFNEAHDTDADPTVVSTDPALDAAFTAIEHAFRAKNLVLCSVHTGGGDHLWFAALPPDIANTWMGVPVAQTHNGDTLGLTRPQWDVFKTHLVYAGGIR